MFRMHHPPFTFPTIHSLGNSMSINPELIYTALMHYYIYPGTTMTDSETGWLRLLFYWLPFSRNLGKKSSTWYSDIFSNKVHCYSFRTSRTISSCHCQSQEIPKVKGMKQFLLPTTTLHVPTCLTNILSGKDDRILSEIWKNNSLQTRYKEVKFQSACWIVFLSYFTN